MNYPNEKLTWAFLFKRSYGLYRERFWQYLKITFFPALVLYLGVSLVQQLQTDIQKDFLERLSRADFEQFQNRRLLVLTLLSQLRFCVYWLSSSLLFGAVACITMNRSTDNETHFSDLSSMVIKRLGGIFVIGLTTFLPMFIFGPYLIPALAGFLSGHRLSYSIAAQEAIIRITQVILVGLLAKFGLAIPALMGDRGISVSTALRYSWQATANWELFFMLFVIKSSILALVSYELTWRALYSSWHYWHIPWQYYSHVTTATGILIGALIEIPLFIAFSALYSELKSKPEETAVVVAPAIG